MNFEMRAKKTIEDHPGLQEHPVELALHYNPEECPFYEQIPEDVKKYLKRRFSVKIIIFEDKRRLPMGLWDYRHKIIYLSEKNFSKELALRGEGWENTFLHEFGHLLDSGSGSQLAINIEPESQSGLSADVLTLTKEAVAEIYKNLVISPGIDNAVLVAREKYRNNRSAWMCSYNVSSDVHVDWGYARKRAIKLYDTKESAEMREKMGL